MAKTNVEQVSYADLAETTIEKIPAPENTFAEQEIDHEQEVDHAEVEPAELAQEDAMDGGYFDGSNSRRYSRTSRFAAQAGRTGSLYRMAAQNRF